MSLMAGSALRQFQKKYFGTLRSFGYSRSRINPALPGPRPLDPVKFGPFLNGEEAARRYRIRHGTRQIRVFLFLLTVLPILAFILALLF